MRAWKLSLHDYANSCLHFVSWPRSLKLLKLVNRRTNQSFNMQLRSMTLWHQETAKANPPSLIQIKLHPGGGWEVQGHILYAGKKELNCVFRLSARVQAALKVLPKEMLQQNKVQPNFKCVWFYFIYIIFKDNVYLTHVCFITSQHYIVACMQCCIIKGN